MKLLFTMLMFAGFAHGQCITNVAATPAATSAQITWTTCTPATSQVKYGKTTTYGGLTPLDSNLVTQHSVAITGLSSNTLYHYIVKSHNATKTYSSQDHTFTTTAGGAIAVTIAPTSASIQTSTTKQFTATVTNCGTNCGVTWSETGNGTVSSSGLFTAPSTAETDTVKATSVADATKSATATVTVTTAPPTHSVDLSCTASTTQGVTGYNFYRSTVSGGPYSQVNIGLAPACSFTDNMVNSGTTYFYVARAFDGSQESVNSNQVTAVIP